MHFGNKKMQRPPSLQGNGGLAKLKRLRRRRSCLWVNWEDGSRCEVRRLLRRRPA